MEERKLNLNTPLLSVRRNRSTASVNSASFLKGRMAETSSPKNQQKILAFKNVESMDLVTEPVSVPFTWEDVPGKAKDDGEPELLPIEQTLPAIPMIAAGNSSSIHDDCSEKESRERSQTEKGSVTEEDERYSDAVDTLSPTNSFSVSCSVSNHSGSDFTVMKPSGTFSIDAQTRDFMMGRFLPAARAMAIASEASLHGASRKPHVLLIEQSKEVEKPRLLAIESGTPSRHHNMEVVKYFTQDLCETESSEEEEEQQEESEDDRSVYGTVTEKGCGLLPQLCLKSSLRLVNPVPGLTSKVKNSMPFVPAIRKDSKVESISQSVFKSGEPQVRSEHRVKTPVSEVGTIKPPGGLTRRNFSGELQKIGGRLSPFRSRKNDVAISDKRVSSQPATTATPLDGMKRLSLSGELRPTRKLSPFRSSRNDVAMISEKNGSPRPPHVVPRLGMPSRLNFSGELQTTSRLSPFRPSRNDNVSSEKRELPLPMLGRVSQHNFSGELRTTSRLSPLRPPRNDVVSLEKNESPWPSHVVPPLGGPSLSRHNFSGELRPAGRLSPFRPLRDDITVSEEKKLSSQPSYAVPPLGWPGRRNFSGEMQTQRRQSPLRPPRNHTMTLKRDEKKDVSTLSPAFERTLYVDTVNAGPDSCLNLNALDREVLIDPVESREVEKTSTGKSSFQDIECLNNVSRDRTSKEVDDGIVDPSSLHLPSLKLPTESWLWHALPSKSDRSLFSSLQKTTPLPTFKKRDSDTPMADAKWETIVKTSKTHNDHTRYSEELVEHIPRKYKY